MQVAIAAIAARSSGSAAAGAPPILPFGGLELISNGGRAWLDLNLVPGDHVAVCFVPDPASGERHLELGMLIPFTVTA